MDKEYMLEAVNLIKVKAGLYRNQKGASKYFHEFSAIFNAALIMEKELKKDA